MTSHLPDPHAYYTTWGAPREFAESVAKEGGTSQARFGEFLGLISEEARKRARRITPLITGAESTDIMALPRAVQWRWRVLEGTLCELRPRGVMSMLPPLWQMEPITYFAVRAARAPLFMSQADNHAVAARAIDLAGVDTVIATFADALRFSLYLDEHGDARPSHWVLVQSDSPLEIPTGAFPSSEYVTIEYHPILALPVFYQCGMHARARADLVHISPDFALETGSSGARITATDPAHLPIWKLLLPYGASQQSPCTDCGETSYHLC